MDRDVRSGEVADAGHSVVDAGIDTGGIGDTVPEFAGAGPPPNRRTSFVGLPLPPGVPTGNQPSDIRTRVEKLKGFIDDSYIHLGRDFHEIQRRSLHKEWGYETFKVYACAEFDGGYRQARRLKDIYRRLIDQLRLTEADMADIHLSKAETILPVASYENIDEWLGKARTLTLDALRIEVAKEQGRTARARSKWVTFTFKVRPEDAEIVDAAFDRFESEGGRTPGEMFMNICMEALTGRIVKTESPIVRLPFLVDKFQRAFGVTLFPAMSQEAADVLTEAMEAHPDLFDK